MLAVPISAALLLVNAVQPPPDADGLDALPVKEVTVFKDGHALVRREGTVPVNNGVARVDGLPEPLFGTFWPYAVGDGVNLASATAGYQAVTLDRTPLTPEEILTAAAGLRVLIHQRFEEEIVSYEAEILPRPTRSAEERARHDPDPGGQPPLPERGPVLFLKTDDGVRVVPIDSINEFTLLGAPPATVEQHVVRTGLKLRIERDGDAAGNAPGDVTAGLSYVQKGLKWVPQYRVEMGDDGEATVTLQAVLVNDLIDLNDAAVNLVVGVPTFAFEGETDPISLQVAYEAVGGAARKLGRNGRRGYLSNSVQTQMRGAMAFDAEADVAGEAAPAVEVGGGARAEDLYVYELKHVTLAEGERMTVRVREFTVPYEDKYAALFPAVPPRELIQDPRQQEQLARLLTENNVKHTITLKNSSDAPFTTAPALLYRGAGEDRTLLAQGLMTYAAPGGESEIDLGTAVEVSTDLTETVTNRAPEPRLSGDDQYHRITLRGEVKVTNRRPEPTTIELTRLVAGVVDSAGDGGKSRELGPADLAKLPPGASVLSDYGVPNWWVSLNPTSEIEWTVTVPPGESKTVPYEWHYFWRR